MNHGSYHASRWLRSLILSKAAGLSMLLPGAVALSAQQPPQSISTLPAMNGNLVFLDPAHGGTDSGTHLTESIAEKDVTLSLEIKLRAALAAKSFSVVSSRDGDASLTSDQRADIGNHARPLACILLHATTSGSGPSLAASSLAPATDAPEVLPWQTAQAAYISQSLALLDGVSGSLRQANLHPVVLRASVPPIDSLTCPAILLEMAPLSGTAPGDSNYQQRLVDALIQALIAWRTQIAPTLPKAPPRTVSPQPYKPVQPTGIDPQTPPGGTL